MAYGISIRDKRRRPVAGCFTPFVIITGIAFFFTPSGFITDKQGKAWVIAVKDGNMKKTVVARPEHLRPLE